MRRWAVIACVGLALLVAFPPGNRRTRPPGVLVEEEPYQELIDRPRPWQKGEYTITPLAAFQMRGRVLHTKRYWTGQEAEISPIDLALAWGPMSDSAILEDINISQSMRFAIWHADTLKVEPQVVNTHMSNMHMIPASAAMERRLKELRIDDLISLSGYLVEVTRPDGWHWTSSLTRDDLGAGACELIWVEDLQVHSRL